MAQTSRGKSSARRDRHADGGGALAAYAIQQSRLASQDWPRDRLASSLLIAMRVLLFPPHASEQSASAVAAAANSAKTIS
jgi:hypothetical protein